MQRETFNKHIQALAKSSHSGMTLYDRNLHVCFINSFMENLTGINSQDVIGKKVLKSFLTSHKKRFNGNWCVSKTRQPNQCGL